MPTSTVKVLSTSPPIHPIPMCELGRFLILATFLFLYLFRDQLLLSLTLPRNYRFGAKKIDVLSRSIFPVKISYSVVRNISRIENAVPVAVNLKVTK